MEIVLQTFLNSLITAAQLTIVAMGFHLSYRIVHFFDLSLAALLGVGGYLFFVFFVSLQMHFIFSVLLTMASVGFLGVLIEYVIYAPLRRGGASNAVLLISSLGVMTILQSVLALFFSDEFRVPTFPYADISFEFFGGVLTFPQLTMIILATLIFGKLFFLLRYTRFGIIVRAISDDAIVATTLGVPTERYIKIIFFISAALLGLAGIFRASDAGIEPTMGFLPFLFGVAAAIIGGLESFYGVVVGSLFIGIFENFGLLFFSGEWRSAITFAALLLFLLFRPKGIVSSS